MKFLICTVLALCTINAVHSVSETNGTNNYYSFPDFYYFQTEATFGAYYLPYTNTGTGSILSKKSSGAAPLWSFGLVESRDADRRAYCVVGQNDSTKLEAFSGALAPNTSFYHVVCVFKANSYLKEFVNGKLVNTVVSNSGAAMNYQSPQDVQIGHDNIFGGYFKGQIADVEAWNYAMSDSEVEAWYKAGVVGYGKLYQHPKLVLGVTFDQAGDGQSYISPVVDFSSRAWVGALVGTPVGRTTNNFLVYP